ncbi:MAG: hypothetical protein HFE44_11580 [Oscillospiraceae bacterium]|jgi:hypothetical protein|nr:hypothetical protein [Oscillospiraceae bacterium]
MSKKEGVKKPIYKKWWFWVIVLLGLSAIGNLGKETEDDSSSQSSSSQTTSVQSSSVASSSEIKGSSDRDSLNEALGDPSALFYDNVQNDVTGNWRLMVYSSPETIVDHAVEYYNAYFESDKEIHWAVNQELKTTSCISVVLGDLHIDVHEYVDKEENDAKVLGGGKLLNSYIVNPSSGEIDNLSNVTGKSGESVSLESIKESIVALLPQEYRSGKWFDVSLNTGFDESVSVFIQIDQGSDDSDSALSLATEYFEIVKQEVENAGVTFDSFSMNVVNNGAPVGLFSTSDGKNFVSIANGKRTEISLP